MADARRGARTLGKSDPIDALAVARLAQREPGLPEACLDQESRLLRLLVDHRESLVTERTRTQNRLRWRLHELEPGWDPSTSALHSPTILIKLRGCLDGYQGIVADLARGDVTRVLDLTCQADQAGRAITDQVTRLAPTLLRLPGCGALTAAKLIGETAGVSRLPTPDKSAMWAGAAAIPVWSANTERFRLNRGGNRQVNAALHRIAVTQLHCHPPAQDYMKGRLAARNTKTEALRALRRHLANTVYHALQADRAQHHTHPKTLAA